MKKFVAFFLLTPFFCIQACEICDFLDQKKQEVFSQLTERLRVLDWDFLPITDTEYCLLIGKLQMLEELKKNLPLCKEKS